MNDLSPVIEWLDAYDAHRARLCAALDDRTAVSSQHQRKQAAAVKRRLGALRNELEMMRALCEELSGEQE